MQLILCRQISGVILEAACNLFLFDFSGLYALCAAGSKMRMEALYVAAIDALASMLNFLYLRYR